MVLFKNKSFYPCEDRHPHTSFEYMCFLFRLCLTAALCTFVLILSLYYPLEVLGIWLLLQIWLLILVALGRPRITLIIIGAFVRNCNYTFWEQIVDFKVNILFILSEEKWKWTLVTFWFPSLTHRIHTTHLHLPVLKHSLILRDIQMTAKCISTFQGRSRFLI